MSDLTYCDACSKQGRRKRNANAPEGWFFCEVGDDTDLERVLVLTACSEECKAKVLRWTRGPGEATATYVCAAGEWADKAERQPEPFFAGTPSEPAIPVEPGVYRHKKGGLYRVLGMARNATNAGDREWLVLYVSLTYGEQYARDAAEFREPVPWPDGKTRPRFERVGPARMAPKSEGA